MLFLAGSSQEACQPVLPRPAPKPAGFPVPGRDEWRWVCLNWPGLTMNHKSVPVLGMGLAAGAALLLAGLVLAIYGTGEKAIRTALDVTARWSFLLFWLAYAGGALGSLFRPAFHGLARRGREFGLAFASAHLVHIGLIVWLGLLINRIPL